MNVLFKTPPPVLFNEPLCGLNDLNSGVGDLYSVSGSCTPPVCITKGHSCCLPCRLAAEVEAKGRRLLNLWRIPVSVSGTGIPVKIHIKSHARLTWMGICEAVNPYLELLGLSGQADGIHHGDEDGDVPERTAHSACNTYTQRISGTFSELH